MRRADTWTMAAILLPVLVFRATPAFAQTQADVADDLINPDRPGIADGSTVIGAGRFQIETGIQYENHRDDTGNSHLLFLPTLLRLGLSSNWELRVEGNTYTWTRSYDPAHGSIETDGFSQLSAGVKYHFLESAGVARPSLGAILRVFPPSGSSIFRTNRTTGDFRLAAEWDFAPEWSLNPNLGMGVYEDAAGREFTPVLFASTMNYNPSKVLNLFADTGIQSPEARRGKTSVIADVGVAYIVGRNVQIDASVGWGAAGATPPRPFLSVGFSKRF